MHAFCLPFRIKPFRIFLNFIVETVKQWWQERKLFTPKYSFSHAFVYMIKVANQLFLEKLRPIFCCALCIPPWMSSLNIPLKAVCHIKLWEIRQFCETKGCIVAFWVLNCFHSGTRVARSVWQNQTNATSRQVQNHSNCKTWNTPLQITYCVLL